MDLPTLVVGNELFILAGVAAAVGLWCLAHRHGKLWDFTEKATATRATMPTFVRPVCGEGVMGRLAGVGDGETAEVVFTKPTPLKPVS